MSVTNTKSIILRGGIVGVALALGIFVACAKKGPPRPTCQDVSDAGADGPNLPPYTTVSTDARPIEAFGMESDPGPQCTDCRQDDAVEIMAVSDFEEAFAPAWFKYGEPGVFIDPLQSGEPITDAGAPVVGASPPQPWWGLQVSTLADLPGGERCGSKYALHMLGGPFTSWGGGYVTRHFTVRGEYMTRCSPDGSQCFCKNGPAPMVDAGPNTENGLGLRPKFMPDGVMNADEATGCIFWASPVAGQPSLLGVDLSDFDGITFWARRGPSGQSSLRVALVDDSVSTDLALFRERQAYNEGIPLDESGANCRRTVECCEQCREMEYNKYVPGVDGGAAAHCEPAAVDKRCHVEGERLPYCREIPGDAGPQMFNYGTGCGPFPEAGVEVDAGDPCWTGSTGAQTVWNDWDDDFELCCPPTMENEDPADRNGDPRYGGTECKPYVFNYDQSSGSYCYHDGEILPEKNQNRCDEGFEASVVVGQEWKLYTVPWAELRRFTPDKAPLNPNGIWQIAFYFGAGYLDTYLDDVGFYRRRK
jgi:hypothetical protein